MFSLRKKTQMPDPSSALPGRDSRPFPVPSTHAVLGTPLEPPFPDGMEVAVFGLGCFWGAERLFWRLDGVYSTAAGYSGGFTPHPTYEEVCSGMTGHTEVVQVVFDPSKVSYADLLKVFFEEHDPTQGMRQGNDVGTQYRSAIYYTTDEQKSVAQDALIQVRCAIACAERAVLPIAHTRRTSNVPVQEDCHACVGRSSAGPLHTNCDR